MDKYIKLENLGKGANGNVILVKKIEDKKLYALKQIFIDKDDKQNSKILNEISILETLDHPNVIKYSESFNHNNKFCIVMEYADKGDLSHLLKKYMTSNKLIEEELIWNYFFQLIEAIGYIHSKKIIHRDIKTQNIFMTKIGLIKLGDFGISKTLENTSDFTKSFLGTPYFLSPEICKGSIYNYKSDIWMLGCVLYELCTFKKPFSGETFHVLMTNIINKSHDKIQNIYSDNLREIIDMLLTKNPEKRPNINEILTQNDFVKESYQSYVETKKKSEIKSSIECELKKLNLQMNDIYSPMIKSNYNSLATKNSNDPFDGFEIKPLSKGYDSTPVKTTKNIISINSINSSNNESKNKISRNERIKIRIKSRKDSISFINQSQIQNNTAEDEFFSSEKQLITNQIHRKSDHCRNPSLSNHIKNNLGKPPILLTKQMPNQIKNYTNKEIFLNCDNKYSKINRSDEIKTENVKNNVNYTNKIKLMLNSLNQKIGDQLSNCINFQNEISIMTSLEENKEKIKTILGGNYKQVVNLIIEIIQIKDKNQTDMLEDTYTDDLPTSELYTEIKRSNKKHKSIGSNSYF